MSKRTRGLAALAIGAILCVGTVVIAQEPAVAGQQGHHYHIFLTGQARMTVNDALDGAIQRLSAPKCQRLFEDFTNEGGRALTTTLAAAGQSPADFLAALYFVEADDTVQCRADEVVAAFTARDSRVVHVCGKRFVRFAAKTKGAEILLIHELLHTLGLGENPPTSSWITNAVMNRCG